MEQIKISVEVSVNLSENTQNFIKSLFASNHAIASATPVIPAKVEAPKQKIETPKKPATPTATPANTEPAASIAPSAPVAPAVSSASKTIEDVRKALSKKVNDHRDAIKKKLDELGAPSVTKMDPSKYDEMYNFLESL